MSWRLGSFLREGCSLSQFLTLLLIATVIVLLVQTPKVSKTQEDRLALGKKRGEGGWSKSDHVLKGRGVCPFGCFLHKALSWMVLGPTMYNIIELCFRAASRLHGLRGWFMWHYTQHSSHQHISIRSLVAAWSLVVWRAETSLVLSLVMDP